MIERLKEQTHKAILANSISNLYVDTLKTQLYSLEQLQAAWRTYEMVPILKGDQLYDTLVHIDITLQDFNIHCLPGKNLLGFESHDAEQYLYLDMNDLYAVLTPNEQLLWTWFLKSY